MNAAALDQWNGGSAPVAECRTEGAVRQGNRPARHIPEGTFAGAGPLSGEGRTMRDPELAAGAQRTATRLDLHGNNGARCMDSRSRPDSRS